MSVGQGAGQVTGVAGRVGEWHIDCVTIAPMTASPAHVGADTRPWTCPFCPLLCDGFQVQTAADVAGTATSLSLIGSDCAKAKRALAQFDDGGPDPQVRRVTRVNGQACELDAAVAAAAQILSASRQPLFAGMGCDVAGARALYTLAAATGAICDSANGSALMHGLRALQDRGAFTTTLAEVRTRADVIVCVGASPSENLPEFFRRSGVFENLVPRRHVVVLGEQRDGSLSALEQTEGVSVESVALHADLFTTVAELAALVAGRAVPDAPPALRSLAAALSSARYAVVTWEAARLPPHGALIVETLNRLVGTLNRSTRAATLPLGGGDGAATVNQVFTWLSGLPMRSRNGPLGLEHEPLCFDSARLLADGSVDALLWVSCFGADSPPPSTTLPSVVLGHPGLAAAAAGVSTTPSVFFPVSTPGIGSDGHLFRTDGVVLMPLHAVRSDGLPTVADVVRRITEALKVASA